MALRMSTKNKKYTKVALVAGGVLFITLGILVITVFEERANNQNNIIGAIFIFLGCTAFLVKPTDKPPLDRNFFG